MASHLSPLRYIKLSTATARLISSRHPLGGQAHSAIALGLAATQAVFGPGLRLIQTLAVALSFLVSAGAAQAEISPAELTVMYAQGVDKRLQVPPSEALHYGQRALLMLEQAGIVVDRAQYLVLIDRSPKVQAFFLYWLAPQEAPRLIGASPASTGRLGAFDYFETPTGVFAHSLENLDFRAEGTKNEFGIRGYGLKGMRVYDFGWQQARRGWGAGGSSPMRLQLHSTDPDLLEHRLGSVQSKGCIRIPATVNRLIDQYGLLDADYEMALRTGQKFWQLLAGRTPTSTSGRYMVVVDSQASVRPEWSPAPTRR